MDRDDDIARLLPEPPPPRPAWREATLALAMRRFDGEEEIAAARPSQAMPPVRWWSQRAQVGALASVLLVGVIAIPLALQRLEEEAPPIPRPAEPAIERTVTTIPVAPGTSVPDRGASPARRVPPAASPAPRAIAKPSPEPRPEAPAEIQQPAPAAPYAAPISQGLTAHEGIPARAPQSAMAATQPEPMPSHPIVVTGSRLAARAARAAASATPVTVVSQEDAEDVVVTATRKARARKADRRGDWNACTIRDPEQSLRGCKRLVDPGAKGDAGIAAARLADGLARAWQGDWQGAIDALDQAVAARPKLAFAYLNRGLAHAQKGDLARAEADLDLAVRYAPNTARSYYNRSLVRRMRGDERGADADMARAEELDSRYAALED